VLPAEALFEEAAHELDARALPGPRDAKDAVAAGLAAGVAWSPHVRQLRLLHSATCDHPLQECVLFRVRSFRLVADSLHPLTHCPMAPRDVRPRLLRLCVEGGALLGRQPT